MSTEISDVKEKQDSASSGGEHVQSTDQKSGQASDKAAGGEKADAKSSSEKTIPYDRFKEVNSKHQRALEILNWYRERVGEPEEILEFTKWKEVQKGKVEKAGDNGQLTKEQVAQLKAALKQADPETYATLEEIRRDKQERQTELLQDSEDEVRELAEEIGLPSDDEKKLTRFGVMIMTEIKSDPKLFRMWRSGNMACIRKAYRQLDDIVPFLSKKSSKETEDKEKTSHLSNVRRRSMLPTPSAGKTIAGTTPKRKEGTGLDKDTDKTAWEVFQSLST